MRWVVPSSRGGVQVIDEDSDELETLPQDGDADVVTDGEPDVLLDVSELRVDEISLEVEDLRARVSLQADVLQLLKLHVGVEAELGRVKLTIKGVEAKALLKVRLDNVSRILDRVLTTIDNNPDIVEQLLEHVGDAVQEVGTGAGGALGQVGSGAGEALGEVGSRAGEALGEVGTGAGSAVEDVGGTAGEVGRGAGKAVEDVGESAGEAVDDAGARPRRRAAAEPEKRRRPKADPTEARPAKRPRPSRGPRSEGG